MNIRKRRYFAGNSIEQALVLAARHFRLEPERIAFRLVEKRHGFLRVPRRAVIEVDPASPAKPEGATAAEATVIPQRVAAPPRPSPPAAPPPRPAPPPRSPQPPSPLPPRPPRESAGPASESSPPPVSPSADVLTRAREGLEAILRLGGLRLQHEVRLEDGMVQVNLSGPERELLLDDEAELLQAIEYLLKRTLVRAEGEELQCRVDTERFREEREEELRRLALESAATVRSSRQAVRLEAMSPAERRIIHLTLAEQPGVRTESEGEGYFKRVMIQPA